MEPPAPTQCNQQAEQMRHIDLCAQHAESSKLSCPSPLLLWSHTRRGHMAQVKIPGAMFCSAFTSAVSNPRYFSFCAPSLSSFICSGRAGVWSFWFALSQYQNAHRDKKGHLLSRPCEFRRIALGSRVSRDGESATAPGNANCVARAFLLLRLAQQVA